MEKFQKKQQLGAKLVNRHQRYNYPFRWDVDVFGELSAEGAGRRAEEHAAS